MAADRQRRSLAALGLLVATALLQCACSDRSVPSDLRRQAACGDLTCTAADACHEPGTCDTATGRCSAGAAKVCPLAGQACDLADGLCHDLCDNVSCQPSDLCHLAPPCDPPTGRCPAEQPVVCPALQRCFPADGACHGLCDGVICPTSDLCHLPGTCDPSSGWCGFESPKTCLSGQGCSLVDGQCHATDLCAGITCTASDLCHVAGACNPASGFCPAQTARLCPSGQACDLADGLCKDLCASVSCTGGQTCDPGTGHCRDPFVAQVVKDVPTWIAAAIAVDAAGAAYLAAAVQLPTFSLDGLDVTGSFDGQALVARFDPSTHAATWARTYGDTGPQLATLPAGVAVTQDGTVAVIGTFSGLVTIGNVISSSAAIDFLGAVSAADGSGRWAKQFNDGTSGLLKSVHANPSSSTNRIAICGLADRAATDLVPGAAFGGARDLVIGVFDSAGNRLWSRQVGAAGNEECDAVAVDDHGDVYATGRFDGATLAFGGATAPLIGPGTTIRKFLWVAKFDGATGSALASAAYGNTVGNANPSAIAASSLGKAVVVGNFTSALPFGGTAGTLTGAGGADAFVVQFDPTTLAPTWAVRLGGAGSDTASGVALTSLGDVVVTGAFNRTTTGAAALTAASATAPDVFLLKLQGATGATAFAASYGDALMQTGDAVAVNRFGADQVALVGTLNGSIAFPAPAGTVSATRPQDAFLLFAGFAP
jgi:hypothetical protein